MANEIYNTSWWGTALDTARTAGTNPDFFGSQMKLLTSEQDNLVTNGTFDTDSDWVKQSGWTISGGSANANVGNDVRLYQSGIGLQVGKTYLLKFDVSNYVSGAVDGFLGYTKNDGKVYANSNGSFEIEITPTNVSQDFVRFHSVTTFVGSIDNVSVQLVRCDLEDIEAKKCLADWIHTTALKDLNN